jgi:hypothetical protein
MDQCLSSQEYKPLFQYVVKLYDLWVTNQGLLLLNHPYEAILEKYLTLAIYRMADFTQKKYRNLLHALTEQGYRFQTFREYLANPAPKCIILRHDVDKRPQNSLMLAQIESGLGIQGTYNFRARPCSWDEMIIREIASMGHEIGYHYEEMATYKGDLQKAFEAFKENLAKLRKLAPVSTICMHGSPRSRYDSRELWKTYNYKELEISGEPYFDVDFTKVLYLTDTGRRWDGHRVSIRDRVDDSQYRKLIEKEIRIHSTQDIIKAAEGDVLPDSIMFTIHPQRWHKNPILWMSELIAQNLKNVAKRVLLGLGR